MSNGAVSAWGANQSGEEVVPNGLTNVINIAAGWSYSLALSALSTSPFPFSLINPICASHSFSVALQSQIGVNYALEFTSALAPSNWVVVQSTNGTGGILTMTDAFATDPQRFYRVLTH
jgi:hypothetical protein